MLAVTYADRDEQEYSIEYSLEFGFLRLSPATRQKLGVNVMVVHLGI